MKNLKITIEKNTTSDAELLKNATIILDNLNIMYEISYNNFTSDNKQNINCKLSMYIQYDYESYFNLINKMYMYKHNYNNNAIIIDYIMSIVNAEIKKILVKKIADYNINDYMHIIEIDENLYNKTELLDGAKNKKINKIAEYLTIDTLYRLLNI